MANGFESTVGVQSFVLFPEIKDVEFSEFLTSRFRYNQYSRN
jgi:hypothetical protein